MIAKLVTYPCGHVMGVYAQQEKCLAVWRMMGWADNVMEANVSSVILSVILSVTLSFMYVCHFFFALCHLSS